MITKIKVRLVRIALWSLHRSLPPASRIKIYLGEDGKVNINGYNRLNLTNARILEKAGIDMEIY